MLNDTYAVTDLNVLNVDTYHKIRLSQSIERLFYKTPGRRFRPQCFFSIFFFFFFLLLLLHLHLVSFVIVILNYCKEDYKVFIIRNNKSIYLSRMISCLWGWSCYQDQDQDSLLVKRRNDNHSPGPVIRELVPSSHQRSELSNTILCIFSG